MHAEKLLWFKTWKFLCKKTVIVLESDPEPDSYGSESKRIGIDSQKKLSKWTLYFGLLRAPSILKLVLDLILQA